MNARRLLRFLVPLVIAAVVPVAGAEPDAFRELNLIQPNRPTPACDFTVTGLETERLRLSDFKGAVVFLNFWATWCPPCKEEMPSMEQLYRRYGPRGFTILAISIDNGGAAVVDPFVTKLGLTFPVGLDPKLAVANQYNVRALPSTYLIDRAGNIAAVALGPRDWNSTPAHAVIESLLR